MKLQFEKRDVKVRPEKIRAQGKIPAVFYGRKEQSTPISVVTVEFKKVWKEAGESSVITLSGDGENHDALIHIVDIHPVTDEPRHVDFYVVEKGKKVSVKIPIEIEGVSIAVKELNATLVTLLHEIEVEALPKDLPQNIVIDISALKELDSHIAVKDIAALPGVEILTNPDDIIVIASAPKEEKEEEAAPVDLSAIEVAKKGKEKEPEETPEE